MTFTTLPLRADQAMDVRRAIQEGKQRLNSLSARMDLSDGQGEPEPGLPPEPRNMNRPTPCSKCGKSHLRAWMGCREVCPVN